MSLRIIKSYGNALSGLLLWPMFSILISTSSLKFYSRHQSNISISLNRIIEIRILLWGKAVCYLWIFFIRRLLMIKSPTSKPDTCYHFSTDVWATKISKWETVPCCASKTLAPKESWCSLKVLLKIGMCKSDVNAHKDWVRLVLPPSELFF